MRQAGAGWKRIPFIKLTGIFIGGILCGYYYPSGLLPWLICSGVGLVGICLFSFTKLSDRFRFRLLPGVGSLLVFFSLGVLAVSKHDIRRDPYRLSLYAEQAGFLFGRLREPPLERPSTYKLTVDVFAFGGHSSVRKVKGGILIYLRKDKKTHLPDFDDVIIFRNRILPVAGFGNPGDFDYGRYCLFKGITHQVFVERSDLLLIKSRGKRLFQRFIYSLRENIIKKLRKYIPGQREQGLAEALLIGYRNDLDKSLVKDYSDAGVVHIIAISGLHVGLIYWLLSLLIRPLARLGFSWVGTILLIAGLWFFSFLAGAQPSILRAALMFSCMALQKQVSGGQSTYNTIAFSAFVLLAINPFWIWDAGFQLSYAAVISIIAFMKPIYGLFYFRNKFADMIWKMNAVTISAQILTAPICVLYFHQFPTYFLLTNFIAVPLSTLILFGEIILMTLTLIPPVAIPAGKLISTMIRWMNEIIHIASDLPLSTWQSLSVSIPQTIILLIFMFASGFAFIEKSRQFLRIAMLTLLAFAVIRLSSFLTTANQNKLVVYNVPRAFAVDIISARKTWFIGDSSGSNEFLTASRTLHRSIRAVHSFASGSYRFSQIRFHIVDEKNANTIPVPGSRLDLLILTGDPKLYLSRFLQSSEVGQVVIASNVPAWRSRYWKKDCDSMQIPWHDVATSGAFVMTLP